MVHCLAQISRAGSVPWQIPHMLLKTTGQGLLADLDHDLTVDDLSELSGMMID